MLSKEEIKKWLLENCVNDNGTLYLSDLDFSDFDGDVDIGGMTVKNNLYQSSQDVGGNLEQRYQKVGRNLDQNFQKVGGNLEQICHEVGGHLWEGSHEVKGDFYQGSNKARGGICNPSNGCLEDNGLLHALSECKSLIDSNLELLRAKAKAEADFKYDAMYAEFESECSYREARAAAFDEAVEMAKQMADAMERWIGFAKKKEKKQ